MVKGPRSLNRAQLVLILVLAVVPFLRTLGHDFVDLDDPDNFLLNQHFRGLGIANLWWMFTSIHLGHYMPVTWLTHALDYTLWGMDPRGYHLQSLVWHGVTAVLFAHVLVALLRRACPTYDARAVGTAAIVGALLFAVHPLRVESVAWVTERRDVVSGALLMVSLLAWLRATEDEARAGRWRAASLLAYSLSLLAKTSGMVLPGVLLVLSAYPLGCFARGVDGKRPWRARFEELAPWFVLAMLGAWVGWLGQYRSGGAVSGLDELGIAERAAIAIHGFAFYPVKTLWPSGLSPLYPLGEAPRLGDARTLVSLVLVIAATAGALALRRRRPALLATWLAYLIIILPMVGIAHVGVQFAGDRFSYLGALPFAVLASAAVLVGRAHPRHGRLVSLAVPLVLVALAGLSWRQTGVWRDSVSMWSRVAAEYPASHVAWHRLGAAFVAAQRPAEAIPAFERAVELASAPDDENACYELAEALFAAGEVPAAREAAAKVLDARATHLGALLLSEEILVRAGRASVALDLYRDALAEDPSFVPAYVRSSHLLRTQLHNLPGALTAARRALALAPASDAAHAVLGLALLDMGDASQAEPHLRAALARDPGNAALRAAYAACKKR